MQSAKKQILWLAPYVPYAKVRHAGGKNMNYYINYINNTGEFDITFIGLAYENERKEVDLEERGIKSDIYYRDHSLVDSIMRRVVSIFTLLNPWTKYYKQMLLYEHIQLSKRVKKFKAAGGNPDIVMLHWTSMGLLLPEWKKLFPNAKFILIEEDVTYLGYQRKYEAAKEAAKNANIITAKRAEKSWARLYHGLKRDELKTIKNCDLTVTLNPKDRNLLIKDGIVEKKLFECSNYFDRHTNITRNPENKTLMFYGAMDRAENYDSAIWFIDNAFQELARDGYKLNIVGANPVSELKEKVDKFNTKHQKDKQIDNQKEYNLTAEKLEPNKHDSNKLDPSKHKDTKPINLTGFVDSVDPYFEKSLCLVAPLLLGAGIKVKVQEAMSAGVPVITNDIGIEGIAAEDMKEYIHATTANDYIEKIKALSTDDSLAQKIGENAKKYIENHNDIDKQLELLVEEMRK